MSTSWCLHLDSRTRTLMKKRLADRSGDRDSTVASVGLEWADQLVLGRRTVGVADADEAADPGLAVGSGSGDLGGRELSPERDDAAFELLLLLEQIVKGGVVGQVAILAGVPHPFGEDTPRVGAKKLEVAAETLVSLGADQNGRVCSHNRLLSVAGQDRFDDRPAGRAPLSGHRPISQIGSGPDGDVQPQLRRFQPTR
jgi:hypothetical protein